MRKMTSIDSHGGVHRVSEAGEVERLIAPIVLGFSADPFVRWMLPGSHQFLTTFTTLTRSHGGTTAEAGGAFATRDGRSAAFWYPPGVHPDGEAIGGAFRDAGVGARVGAVWDEAERYEPAEPHWYLRQVGVDPVLQGQGVGSALMRAGLAAIDEEGDPAYLEATSAPSRAFYERHGFEVLGEVSVGGSAPLWPMARERR